VEKFCEGRRDRSALDQDGSVSQWPASQQVCEIAEMFMMISPAFGRRAPLRIVALCVALSPLMALSGCYSVHEELPAPPPVAAPAPQVRLLPPPPSRPKQELASWYGPGFNGRRTTTGERFNQNAMTAASKTLPLGSHVVVTNPQNGRSVEVRINDRGPHVRGRTLDLSKRAAQKLGITKKGVARVEITPSDAKHAAGVAPITPLAVSPTPVPESHI
jgi:rare lipoprotein A